jgi:hypothetical protein
LRTGILNIPLDRFEEEKRALEKELVRLHDSMRAERARRVEQEATEAGLRQDLSRAHEAYKQVNCPIFDVISLARRGRCTVDPRLLLERLRGVGGYRDTIRLNLSSTLLRASRRLRRITRELRRSALRPNP